MAEPSGKLKEVRLTTPVRHEDLRRLELGDVVYLDGLIYTGRESVYKRVLQDGVAPPVDLKALTNVNFHCSPAASRNADGTFNVGAVTATASFRFSKWLPKWLLPPPPPARSAASVAVPVAAPVATSLM